MWRGKAVHVGDSFSTVGDTLSTDRLTAQYSGGITSVQWGNTFSTVRVFSALGG